MRTPKWKKGGVVAWPIFLHIFFTFVGGDVAHGESKMNASTDTPNKPPRASICEGSIKDLSNNPRLVVARYFLDRPGYDLRHSSARLWERPPGTCSASHVESFLKTQGIAIDDLLVEIYVDKFESYMLLEACVASHVQWNFQNTTYNEPGILNVRLTDMIFAQRSDALQQPSAPQLSSSSTPRHANTISLGLFSFSVMVGLETAAIMAVLIPGSINLAYVLAWGPYMFFIGGFLQVIVGIFQVVRNNIYGATAFLGFGTIWFSYGAKSILETYFSGDVPEEVLASEDPLGNAIRSWYVLAFSCVLLKQTFVMSKLSTTLIALLCLKIFAASLSGWSTAMAWVQLVLGWIVSFFAFYVFTVEFTNDVYHREVFPTFKWSKEHSPEEVFGAAGRQSTLYSRAAMLRHAGAPTVQSMRSILPSEQRPKDV